MNESVYENYMPKCIVVSLEKKSPKSRFLQTGLPEYPLKKLEISEISTTRTEAAIISKEEK